MYQNFVSGKVTFVGSSTLMTKHKRNEEPFARRMTMMVNAGWVDEELFKKFRELMPIAAVDILAVYQGKLLLMLRNNEPGKDLWWTPGGRVRYGETLEEAAIRELNEETGLTALKLEKKGVMSQIWSQGHFVTTFFRVNVMEDRVKLNDEHRDYKWISEITDDLHPYLIQMIREAEIFIGKQ